MTFVERLIEKFNDGNATISFFFVYLQTIKMLKIRIMRKFKLVGMAAFALAFAVSCLNNSDDYVENQESGWIVFVNASPGSSQLRLYTDDTPVPGQELNYGEFNSYARVPVGEKQISARQGGSSLATSSLTVELNGFYGVYAVNMPDHMELVTYLDNHSTPENINKTVFRFMQLSYNTPTVKLKFETEEEDFGEYNFKESSPFMEIQSFDEKNVYLIDEATSDTLATKKISMQGRKSYVLFSKGELGSSNENQKLDLQLIQF